MVSELSRARFELTRLDDSQGDFFEAVMVFRTCSLHDILSVEDEVEELSRIVKIGVSRPMEEGEGQSVKSNDRACLMSISDNTMAARFCELHFVEALFVSDL